MLRPEGCCAKKLCCAGHRVCRQLLPSSQQQSAGKKDTPIIMTHQQVSEPLVSLQDTPDPVCSACAISHTERRVKNRSPLLYNVFLSHDLSL